MTAISMSVLLPVVIMMASPNQPLKPPILSLFTMRLRLHHVDIHPIPFAPTSREATITHYILRRNLGGVMHHLKPISPLMNLRTP